MNTQVNARAARPRAEPQRYYDYCRRYLPELCRLEQLVSVHAQHLKVDVVTQVVSDDQVLPVYALTLGSRAAEVPVIALVGGVHGVERIGSQILLVFLENLCRRLHWDTGLQEELKHLRLVFLPLLNPVGMARGWRSNGHGVDLMRNAPLDARDDPVWMLGGQRVSHHLPWFRGAEGEPMQAEAMALCTLVEQQLFPADFSMVLDVHSGFGVRDRLWFPYAGSREPLEHLAELGALNHLLDETYPHHNYLMEPQFDHYICHGDLWDYLYRRSLEHPEHTFIPLTLEIGSWLWVKKNPRQLISFSGLFNPVVPHRHQRTMRRHHLLLEFMMRAVRSSSAWLPTGKQRSHYQINAIKDWYG